jgi:hypothetical protein
MAGESEVFFLPMGISAGLDTGSIVLRLWGREYGSVVEARVG